MQLVSECSGLLLTLALSTVAIAQVEGEAKQLPTIPAQQQTALDLRLHLKYGVFDPLLGAPMVPEVLQAGAASNLYIVQFGYPFTDAERDAIRDVGGKLHSPLPHCALIVRSDAGPGPLATIAGVRWVGPFHPAYRMPQELRTEVLTGAMPARRYNMVMADKRDDKATLQQHIEAIGGKVIDRRDGGLLFTAELTREQLLLAAGFDEVLWIEAWTEPGVDMNNARTVQGTAWLQTNVGYTGAGIRGHVYEGVEATHPDFTFTMTNVRSGGEADSHGHCTAGIVFGNGSSDVNATGHAPGARGYYTNYNTVTAGWSRNMVIDEVVNVYNCLFTTASWGHAQTTEYTADSADADDIVFDHGIPWTQSQSNTGNRNSRPEAWAKNVISVGGLRHYDDANPGNDLWAAWPAGGLSTAASIGPASDGRIKPDLCNFYDDILTSDRTGLAGYSSGSTAIFGGTSGATPATAGLNAVAIQMYTDHILGTAPRVHGGTRFQNRPYAQTVKALQIACASLYPIAQSTRPQQGWGYANVRTIWDNRNNMFLVPENAPITQGSTHTYYVAVAPGQSILKVCMTYLDPQGNVSASIDRINDLTLRVWHPNGTTAYYGNYGLSSSNTSTSGGSANTVDTVECVIVNNPTAGQWRIEITAPVIAQDAYLATAATDATYALAVRGGTRDYVGCARYIPDASPTDGGNNVIPFGTQVDDIGLLTSNFSGTTTLNPVPGAIFFDMTPAVNLYWNGIELNIAELAGASVTLDVYTHNTTYVGNTGTMTGWTARTAGKGTSAGPNNPTLFQFNDALYQAGANTIGVAIVARDFHHRYSTGSGTWTNADLSFTGGASGVLGTTTFLSPRVPNVTLRYRNDDSEWHNQIYQTLLRSDDLGGAGNITDLAVVPTWTGRHYNRYLQIRMSHVPAGYTMSTVFANNLPSPVTVLPVTTNHSFECTADTWTPLGLSTPFAYNGTSDVVVEILARGNHDTALGTHDGFLTQAGMLRLYAHSWPFTAQPTSGTLSTSSGLKVRAEFACANAGAYGTSCGPISAVPFSTPVAGTSFWFDIVNALPGSGAVIGIGFNRDAPYPVTLNPYGFNNCFQWNDNLATRFLIVPASGHTWHRVDIPNTTDYDGLRMYGHWYNLDAAQPGSVTVSNYVRMIIGQENP